MADVYPEDMESLGCSEEFDPPEQEEFVPGTPDGDEGPEEVPPPPKKRCVKKPKSFRLNAKQLFLTYPQCPIPKEDALNLVSEVAGDPEEYIVAQENHQVKGPISRLYALLSQPFLSATEYMSLTAPQRKYWENNIAAQFALNLLSDD